MLTFDAATHAYRWQGNRVPSVTQVLAAARLYDLSGATAEQLDYARDRGTAIHEATALDDQHDLDERDLDDEIRPYLASYRRFLLETGFVVEKIEQRVYHPKYRYAGTFDREGLLPIKGRQRPTIIDIKSGQPQAADGPQLAAYDAAIGGRDARFDLYLQADGRYNLVHRSNRDFGVFLAALTLYNFRGNNGTTHL